MAWLVLVISGALEAVWATALESSNGFRRLGPSLLFLAALTLSMAGLGYAMTSLPVGTSYAVWVGIGATLTVVLGLVRGTEPVAAIRLLLLALLVGSVVGLKLVA